MSGSSRDRDTGRKWESGASKRKRKAEMMQVNQAMSTSTVLQEGEKSDIQSFELYEELQLIISSLPDFIKDAKQLIKYIIENNLQEIYPNVYITVRIMLTIPVSTASAERSFSKLKIIKNYLRNTMTQERLSALAVLSIETKIANNLNYEDILKTFSEAKSRKVHFL
ncbi:uncharacterized protein LOC132952716 [Metopolophium dirhodum]|uniref:uncharacterized protein LOC132952716 n=1 Tax=Metopolophium dirhodum TaxID=44670 RepID=UPI0029904F95|nr:uncharacterized protein LOC132952716 [Metopolophium dirhodum]